jgi:hypothetical protein
LFSFSEYLRSSGLIPNTTFLPIYSLRYSTDENGRLLSPASQSVTSGDDGLLVSAEAIGDYYFVS